MMIPNEFDFNNIKYEWIIINSLNEEDINNKLSNINEDLKNKLIIITNLNENNNFLLDNNFLNITISKNDDQLKNEIFITIIELLNFHLIILELSEITIDIKKNNKNFEIDKNIKMISKLHTKNVLYCNNFIKNDYKFKEFYEIFFKEWENKPIKEYLDSIVNKEWKIKIESILKTIDNNYLNISLTDILFKQNIFNEFKNHLQNISKLDKKISNEKLLKDGQNSVAKSIPSVEWLSYIFDNISILKKYNFYYKNWKNNGVNNLEILFKRYKKKNDEENFFKVIFQIRFYLTYFYYYNTNNNNNPKEFSSYKKYINNYMYFIKQSKIINLDSKKNFSKLIKNINDYILDKEFSFIDSIKKEIAIVVYDLIKKINGN